MRMSTVSSVILCLTLAVPILVTAAQTNQEPPARTPDGRPDLQGIWDYATLTPLERARQYAGSQFLTEEQAARAFPSRSYEEIRPGRGEVDLDRGTNRFWHEYPTALTRINGRPLASRIIDPPDGRLPSLLPEAAARYNTERMASYPRERDGPEFRRDPERCLGPTYLSPSADQGSLLQIVQTADHVLLYAEGFGVARIAPFRPQPQAGVRARNGVSRASWEGDTLVIRTANYRPGRSDFGRLEAADENLQLTERLTLQDATTLIYEVTVNDPTVYTRPWTLVQSMSRTTARMFEYACHEGNYSLVNILRGARVEDGTVTTVPVR